MRNIEKAKPKNATAKSAASASCLLCATCADSTSSRQSRFSVHSVTERSSTTRALNCTFPTRYVADFVSRSYYGGPNGFDKVYQQCLRYSEGLLRDMGFGTDEGGKL